jgi:hypothetical protein
MRMLLIKDVYFEVSVARRSEDEQVEEFKGALIACFEDAIDRGLAPTQAIAAILELASQEMARIRGV